MPDVLVTPLSLVAAVALALAASWLIGRAVRAAARRWPLLDGLTRRGRLPMRMLLIGIAVTVTIELTTEPASWWPSTTHLLTIILIIAFAWLLILVSVVVEQAIDANYPTDVPDNRHARRVRTQVEILRRLVSVVIVIVAIAAIMFTFPSLRGFGASILASAGLASIIAGLAAQTSLANIFAGMQIAFSDALRVDDVVVVEGEWGRIEQVTMTYVVVQIWDDRRLVLPSTYFTTTPFQNWTRESSELLGSVELDVDWTVPIDGLRAEMVRLLDGTDLWDHRVAVVQVTDATEGRIRVRVLTSAESGPVLWDLRCYLREGLVTWLQRQDTGLPRARVEMLTEGRPERPAPGRRAPDDTGALFTGSERALARSLRFRPHPFEVDAEESEGSTRPRSPHGEGGGTHGDT